MRPIFLSASGVNWGVVLDATADDLVKGANVGWLVKDCDGRNMRVFFGRGAPHWGLQTGVQDGKSRVKGTLPSLVWDGEAHLAVGTGGVSCRRLRESSRLVPGVGPPRAVPLHLG